MKASIDLIVRDPVMENNVIVNAPQYVPIKVLHSDSQQKELMSITKKCLKRYKPNELRNTLKQFLIMITLYVNYYKYSPDTTYFKLGKEILYRGEFTVGVPIKNFKPRSSHNKKMLGLITDEEFNIKQVCCIKNKQIFSYCNRLNLVRTYFCISAVIFIPIDQSNFLI